MLMFWLTGTMIGVLTTSPSAQSFTKESYCGNITVNMCLTSSSSSQTNSAFSSSLSANHASRRSSDLIGDLWGHPMPSSAMSYQAWLGPNKTNIVLHLYTYNMLLLLVAVAFDCVVVSACVAIYVLRCLCCVAWLCWFCGCLSVDVYLLLCWF